MNYQQFIDVSGARVESYIRRYARSFGIFGDAIRDLRQEAHLAIFCALPYWRSDLRRYRAESDKSLIRNSLGGGGSGNPGPSITANGKSGTAIAYGKSAFNWCAGPMRRAMESSVRREFGLKPFATDPISDKRVEFRENLSLGFSGPASGLIDDESSSLACRLDLRRALAIDETARPIALNRFIQCALSPSSGADLARDEGISRQAICIQNKRTQKRLKALLGAGIGAAI